MNTNQNPSSSVSTEQVRLALVAEAAGELPRRAATSVRGIAIEIQCPAWCVTDHAVEDLAFLEDLHHYGEPVALTVPVYGGGTEEVLVAHLAQWPLAKGDEDRGEPYLAVDADNSGEVSALMAPAALAFADQLVAHAERIRAEVAQLSGGRS